MSGELIFDNSTRLRRTREPRGGIFSKNLINNQVARRLLSANFSCYPDRRYLIGYPVRQRVLGRQCGGRQIGGQMPLPRGVRQSVSRGVSRHWPSPSPRRSHAYAEDQRHDLSCWLGNAGLDEINGCRSAIRRRQKEI